MEAEKSTTIPTNTWEHLKSGDEVPYVVLNEKSVRELTSGKTVLSYAKVTDVQHIEQDNTYIINVIGEHFNDIVCTVKEYFTENGAVAESETSVLIIGTDKNAFAEQLKSFIKQNQE